MMYEQGLDSLFLKRTQYNPKKVKGFSDAILIAFRYYKESQTNKNPRDTWRFKGQARLIHHTERLPRIAHFTVKREKCKSDFLD